MTGKASRQIPASAAGLAVFLTIPAVIGIQAATPAREKAGDGIDPATHLWHARPAEKWENALAFLPAVPASWTAGEVRGLVARGGFEIDMQWKDERIERMTILSRNGNLCHGRTVVPLKVDVRGRAVFMQRPEPGVIEFKTEPGAAYTLTPAENLTSR